MKLSYTIKTAFSGIRANTSRSLLTILGIVIGITSIMLVMSVGKGGEELILNQVRGLGSRTIIIEPGKQPNGPSDYAELFTDSLKDREVEALSNPSNVQGVNIVTPNVNGGATVSSNQETIRGNVIGTDAGLAVIFDMSAKEGNMLTSEDVRGRGAVAVLGSKAAEKLFDESSALGEKIKIKNKTFRVVGVLAPKGNAAAFNIDDLVIIPYTTAQEYIFGLDHYNSIMVQTKTEAGVERASRDISATLRELHSITDPKNDDFHVVTQADAMERVSLITSILTALLTSVAAISLVVGGIGIMNIMLVSVTERTREIGLRKAIGATEKDILRQFLLEAVFLTGVGGLLGILLGAILSLLVAFVLGSVLKLDWVYVFPLSAVVLGLSVSSAIGLIFGLYPARQAARKNPIESLRYE
jgi:putative ABC transport system permease protein